MIYGNKFLNYGIDSLSEACLLTEDMNYVDSFLNSLNENVVVTEASFKETISNVFKSIGKVIMKIINFIKDKIIGFFKFVGKFFEKIYRAITKNKNKVKEEDKSFDFKKDFDEGFSKDFEEVQDFYEDKEVKEMESGSFKKEFSDLENTKKDVANNIKARHDTFDDYINKACEEINKNNEEINKSLDRIADIVHNEPDNEAVKILKSFLGGSANTKKEENTKKFYAYNASIDFLTEQMEYGKLRIKYATTVESVFDNARRELSNLKTYNTDKRKEIIDKYVKITDEATDKYSKCFEKSKSGKTYDEEVVDSAERFKKISQQCVENIEHIDKVYRYLNELKDEIDILGQDIEQDSKNKDLEGVQTDSMLMSSLYTSALNYHKVTMSICNFITKEYMKIMKHNVVEGMKFVLYIKKFSMPTK